jgi:prepilin-type N-terminal cleavage/methylation domain-containing protein
VRRRGAALNRGFTLIELMVVFAIVGLLAGLIAFMPRSERRLAAVRSAAEELAATLRTARAIAMDRRIICGVAFNIENAPGTSGRILNNHGGGHWYQITGDVPLRDSTNYVSSYPIPTYNDQAVGGTGNVAQFLDQVKQSWLGDRHVLAPHKVRFLALTDQDTGSGGWPAAGLIPPTYPRPWFGWWDPATRRLYPWGGYDTAIKDNANRSCSGFYYQGDDGPITGGANPADRFTTHIGAYGTVPPALIFKAGANRPVVNGAWLDYVIKFYPDGRVVEQSPMINRRESYASRGTPTAGYSGGGTGIGDLGPYTASAAGGLSEQSPMVSYIGHTGVWSITLAPDMDKDTDTFGSKEAALDSIWPAYRVCISPFGEVTTVRVTRKVPAGAVLDTTTIANWQSATQIKTYYQNFTATTAAGTLRGRPVSEFLTPEILAARQWWMP